MKPRQLITLFLFCCTCAVTAQVKFKVKLLPGNTSYQVLMRPDATWNAPFNATPSAQVTLKVPVGGFQVGTITNLKGTWSNNANIVAPTEAPGFHYIVFGLQGATSAITYASGVEVALFNFANNGNCTGVMELIENVTDPFYPPNSQSVNVGNQISVIGAGIGVNAYTGNYGNFEANCAPSSICGIEVFDVALTSPSACGIADGVISISATTSGGLPLQYSITGLSGAYQPSSTFTGLAAGDIFDIVVRDIAAICIVEVGEFELDGPLAAAITGIDLVDPDCGGSNGNITINAFSENGGILEYAMDISGPWQSSSTFNGLPAGIYPLYVQDIINNCSNYIGDYTLADCPVEPCIITYELVNLGNGQYEVVMHTGTTWNFPNNITASQQVTLKVPTGGFILENLVSQTPNVGYAVNSTYPAPAEEPNYDYISVGLTSFGTQNIPYGSGGTVHLFTFQNGGTCEGDSIFLIQNSDPFYPPNAQNANVGQQITVSGYGGADVPICISGSGAVACETPPPPPPPACLIEFELEKLPNGKFQVSMTSDTTWTAPVNNITATANFTVKVPTGGFVVSNLTSLVSGVNFSLASTYAAPTEDPAHNYISFSLASPGTQGITYTKDLKVPLFTFENSGTCTGGAVFLMDNDTDPFFPPNSQNANVGQQITVSGYGGPDAPICEVNNAADDCAGCTGLVAGFTVPDGCRNSVINFTNTTTFIEPVISWSWVFGDGGTSSLQSPSHTYTSSGNFEVSLTVTTGSGCEATFSEFVTVFSLPGVVPQTAFSICNGDPAQLQGQPDATSWTWTPDTGLSATNIVNPIAGPAATTVYFVTATNADGCSSQDTITITVANKPIITNVTVNQLSDCGVNDASISIVATGVGALAYTVNGGNWVSNPVFTALIPGTYTVFVRNADDSCPVAYNGNPIVITALTAPSITNVITVQPTGCNANGSISISATGGNAPLQYSIDNGVNWQAGNSFPNLGSGSYAPAVANAGGSCAVGSNTVTLNESILTVSSIANQTICDGTSVQLSATLNENIASFDFQPATGISGVSASGNTLNFSVAASNGTINYTLVLTGVSGCTASEAFSAQEVPGVTAFFTASSPACVNGEITLNHTGAALPSANLNWSLDGGIVISSSAATATAPAGATLIVSYQNAGIKNLALTVTQANCSDGEPGSVLVTDFNPGATLNISPVTICGGANGSINLSLATPGNYNFQWNGPGVSATTEDLSALGAGTYNVTITEAASGCSTVSSASITAPTPVSINSVTDNPASDCSGTAADGSLTVSISGGNAPFTYEVFDAGNLAVPIQSQTNNQNSLTLNGLSVGTYQVEVTTAAGCSAIATATVTASGGTLSASLANAQDASCGITDGQFSVNVTGEAPFTYLIYKNNVVTGASQTLNGFTLNVTNLEPATYVVVLTDVNGCISQPVMANIASEPGDFGIAADVVNPACGAEDGSISLSNLPAGAVFSWASNGFGLPTTNPLISLETGVYELVVIALSGCIQELSYTLTPVAGPQIAVDDLMDASCGNANGGLTFNVSGSGTLYDYEILNSNISDFGTYGQDVPVTGLVAGAYVLSVQDVNTSCEAVTAFIIAGSGGNLQGIAVTTPPSACGVEDASICVTLFGGAAPYTLTADLGIAPADPFNSEGCIQGLYEGNINLTVTDSAGCVLNFEVPLSDQPDPSITETDLDITGAVCPGELGSIVSNTSTEYEIFDASTNTFLGVTPWTAASPGEVLVVNESGDCSAEVLVNVPGPADWEIEISLDSASCDANDGAISLEVSGGTAPYTYLWSSAATGSSIQSLDGEQEFAVTVTDDEGCTTSEVNLFAGVNCPMEPCDDIFYVDTFFVALNPGTTEICLPTNLTDLSIFDLTLDNQPYLVPLGECSTVTHFYGYGMLLSLGQPPFKFDNWSYSSKTISDDIEFDNAQELVERMNELDPVGNWILNEGQSSISGGAAGSLYGSLVLTHLASNIEVALEVNVITEPHPGISVNDDPTHIFIATDLDNGCFDELYINLLPDLEPETDTIYLTVEVGEMEFDCLSTEEFLGTPGLPVDICPDLSGNSVFVDQFALCFAVLGVTVGEDQFCLVACDSTGFCDTTILFVTVTDEIDTTTDLVIYDGFSPNGDETNDFFTIKNVDLYPENELIVFNRWGNRVYQTERYNNDWDGKFGSKQLPDGTYFYLFDVVIGGEKKKFKGHLVLHR